jgi:hypothetical protein
MLVILNPHSIHCSYADGEIVENNDVQLRNIVRARNLVLSPNLVRVVNLYMTGERHNIFF